MAPLPKTTRQLSTNPEHHTSWHPDFPNPTPPPNLKEYKPTATFFDLPLELREEIYDLALQDMGPPHNPQVGWDARYAVCVTPRYNLDYWGTERMTRLLRTNKQINAEAATVLYSRFEFELYPPLRPSEVDRWLIPLPAQSRAAIRSIKVVMVPFWPFNAVHSNWPAWEDLSGYQEPDMRKMYWNHMAAFLRLRELLPGLKTLKMDVMFTVGQEELATESLVAQAIDQVRPFAGVKNLVPMMDGVGTKKAREVFRAIEAEIKATVFT